MRDNTIAEDKKIYFDKIAGTPSTVYAVMRHRSKSGVTKHVDFFVIIEGRLVCATMAVVRILNLSYSQKHEAATFTGCNYDIATDVVRELGKTLYGCYAHFRREWI